MRRFVLLLLKLAVVLTVLGGILVAVSVQPVDDTPFHRAPRIAGMEEKITAELQNARPVQGELRSGLGRAPLTPRLGAASEAPERGEFVSLPLAGYGDRSGRPATGVQDELWARAVAFAVAGQTSVVVSADLLIIPPEVARAATDRIAAAGVPPGRVYFGATHTHAGLGGWGEGLVAEIFAGGFQPGVRTWMAQQLAAAAVAALADLTPSVAGQDSFEAPDLVRNRLRGEAGQLFAKFSVLSVKQADGDEAVLGAYAAHSTVLPSSLMEFSGDYPGFWQRSLEQGPVRLAVFLAGAVGSHAPRPPTNGLAGAQAMGEALAQRTRDLLPRIPRTNIVSFAAHTLEVPLPELQLRFANRWRVRPWVARFLLPVGETTQLQSLRVGNALWLSTPCDYSGELAVDLVPPASRLGMELAVTSFNGDYVGYVVPSRFYSMDTYETRTMSFFGPQLPDYFDGLLRVLIDVSGRSPATPAAAR